MSTQTKRRASDEAAKKNRPTRVTKATKRSGKTAASLTSGEVNLSGNALKWLIENTPVHPAARKGFGHPPFKLRDD